MKTDSDLKKDVLSELLWDPLISETKVGVSVKEGVVTLTGHLDTYAEKVAAKRAAERVSGVKAIAVELDVIPAGLHQRSDTEIALAVEHALSWNTSVPQDRVKVTVEKGWITLTGELDWNFQRRAVERMVREARRIDVSVDGSVVTLSGHVHSWAERNAAEGATWSAPGVSRVNNQLTVEA